jgi:cytochrome oxidase Cu insertion factor (SCO1/SenC/PrrC family)
MQRPVRFRQLAWVGFIITSVLLIVTAGTIVASRLLVSRYNQAQAPTEPTADGLAGFPLQGDIAPDFTLTDQFGHTVRLSSLRGHEVVLAFIDSQCISLCPLTAQIMYDAKTHLSSSQASQVELVAVNANPAATSRAAVLAWSYEHGMLHRWMFLTGPAQQLQTIYHEYNVYDQVSNGNVVHDPVTYIIDAQGHERLLYETLDSNAKADLLSQELGLEAGMKQWLPQP